jgi:hypothetical protein
MGRSSEWLGILRFLGRGRHPLDHTARLRTADIQLDWTNTSVMVGQDKPLIAPRDPFSLAQVGVSPFTDAGNLWLWSPQARVEERFKFGADSGLRAQLGLFEMGGTYLTQTAENAIRISNVQSSAGPALEGRFEFWHKFGEHTRIELAPGFHTAQTTENWSFGDHRACSVSTGSRIRGRKSSLLAHLRRRKYRGSRHHRAGLFCCWAYGLLRAVPSIGGMGAVAWLATPKLTFHLIAGQHNNQASEVPKD